MDQIIIPNHSLHVTGGPHMRLFVRLLGILDHARREKVYHRLLSESAHVPLSAAASRAPEGNTVHFMVCLGPDPPEFFRQRLCHLPCFIMCQFHSPPPITGESPGGRLSPKIGAASIMARYTFRRFLNSVLRITHPQPAAEIILGVGSIGTRRHPSGTEQGTGNDGLPTPIWVFFLVMRSFRRGQSALHCQRSGTTTAHESTAPTRSSRRYGRDRILARIR